jgi:hypothetical protein
LRLPSWSRLLVAAVIMRVLRSAWPLVHGRRGCVRRGSLSLARQIGLFKTAVIRRLGPWRSRETVAIATLEWVDGCNHRRLPEPIATSRPPRPR